MIRTAQLADIPYIIQTGKRLHEKSGYADRVPLDVLHIDGLLNACIRSSWRTVILSERNEIIRGFLIAVAEPFWWTDQQRGKRYVTDYAFFSEHRGDGLLMLKSMIEWAWTVPRVIECHGATNIPKGPGLLDTLYWQAGFARVGGMFKISRPPKEVVAS